MILYGYSGYSSFTKNGYPEMPEIDVLSWCSFGFPVVRD